MSDISVKRRIFGESSAYGERWAGNTRCSINATGRKGGWRYRVLLVDRIGNTDIRANHLVDADFMGALAAMGRTEKAKPFIAFLGEFRKAVRDRSAPSASFSAIELACIAILMRGPMRAEELAAAIGESMESARAGITRLQRMSLMLNEDGVLSLDRENPLLGALMDDNGFLRMARKAGAII